tara:strand:+ start:2894 stop:3076 length:183 start_codon:yes stop_codon:yes gene_type:complete
MIKRITLITFAVFMVEAIIHYNLGAKSEKMKIPPAKDLIKMGIIVLIFSIISAQLINYKK